MWPHRAAGGGKNFELLGDAWDLGPAAAEGIVSPGC